MRSRFTDALALRRWRTLNLQRLAPVLGAWHHRVMRERDSKKLQEMNEMESAIEAIPTEENPSLLSSPALLAKVMSETGTEAGKIGSERRAKTKTPRGRKGAASKVGRAGRKRKGAASKAASAGRKRKGAASKAGRGGRRRKAAASKAARTGRKPKA